MGKSALALDLAERMPAEIVSADSRQIYRYMDIGTAKPTAEERNRVGHHLLDIVDPDQTLTLAQYQSLAYAAIEDIHKRGRVPLFVGGSGLYVRAVLEGLRIPRVKPNSSLREQLYREAETKGGEALHSRLRELDPHAADRIDPRNLRRVVRALEVCCELGQPVSSVQKAASPPYRVMRIGLRMERPLLYQRIDQRLVRMLSAGLVDEVRSLLKRGYSHELPSMTALGYRQIAMYLRGAVALQEAVGLIKRHTRRFVRQQANWFRLDDPLIRWFDASEPVFTAIQELTSRFLSMTAISQAR